MMLASLDSNIGLYGQKPCITSAFIVFEGIFEDAALLSVALIPICWPLKPNTPCSFASDGGCLTVQVDAGASSAHFERAEHSSCVKHH